MEKNSTTTLATYLEELSDASRPVSMTRLVNFSDLTPQCMDIFRQKWPGIPVKRRAEILVKLAELAEDNLELNFDRVFAACAGDPDAGVRLRAAEGLGESEDPAFVDTLVLLLENDEEARVRAAAACSLAEYSMMAELNRLRHSQGEKVASSLLAAATNKGEDIEVRRRALEAIGPVSSPEVKLAIREAYESNTPLLKVSAVYAMGQNSASEWLPMLLEELYNGSPEMRYEAATACGELGEAEAVPHLIPLIQDPDFEVQMASINALGKIGGEEAKKALQQCTRSEDPRLAEAARESLEYLEGEEDPLTFTFKS